MNFVNAFIVGGTICAIGQIIYDKTSFGTAKLLVTFVVVGCILSALGIYDKIVEFGGAGATVPITGFGHLLFQGVKKEIENGWVGIFTGGLKSASAGISAVVFFSFVNALIFSSRPK